MQTCNNQRNFWNSGGDFLLILIGSLLFMVLVTLLSGCKQIEYVPVETIKHDSIYINTHKVDTLFKTDSTVIHEKGDTIFYDRWHTIYKVRESIDTIYQSKVDTIQVPYEVVKVEKEKYTPKLVKILAWIGGTALAIFIILAILKLKKFFVT